MTSAEKRFIENLTQSERERYKELGIPLAVAAKFEVRPETNIPIPTSDCHGYQIACLCGKECPKFNEAYELGVRDDECAIFDEITEDLKKLDELSDTLAVLPKEKADFAQKFRYFEWFQQIRNDLITWTLDYKEIFARELGTLKEKDNEKSIF